jgi:hypothetical protein
VSDHPLAHVLVDAIDERLPAVDAPIPVWQSLTIVNPILIATEDLKVRMSRQSAQDPARLVAARACRGRTPAAARLGGIG